MKELGEPPIISSQQTPVLRKKSGPKSAGIGTSTGVQKGLPTGKAPPSIITRKNGAAMMVPAGGLTVSNRERNVSFDADDLNAAAVVGDDNFGGIRKKHNAASPVPNSVGAGGVVGSLPVTSFVPSSISPGAGTGTENRPHASHTMSGGKPPPPLQSSGTTPNLLNPDVSVSGAKTSKPGYV
jgi:hypothetical protein